MNPIRAVVISSVICAASVSHSDSVHYAILGPSGLADCTFATSGSYTVLASVDLSEPASALELSMPESCFGSVVTWAVPVSGDPNSLLTADFGGCVSGVVDLFTAQINVQGCCPSLLHGPVVIGPGQDSPPVLIGCGGERRFLIPPCSATSPSLLTPADGAIVSTTPDLSWSYQYGDYCQEGIGVAAFTILYGTDADNLDQSFEALDSQQATLPALDPYTQYYWRVRVDDDFAYYSGSMVNFSATRSFTTGGPVAIRTSTWGGVKTLYRE